MPWTEAAQPRGMSTSYRGAGRNYVKTAMLMAFLIAIGVVIILGAIVGVAWRERHAPTAQ